jgi:Leucine-rich repeat (LRR) protein
LRELSRDDLQQFGENLREISLSNNKIEVIDGDLFDDTPNVEKITMANNKIGFIESGAFGNLTRLKELSVANNPCTGGNDYAWNSRENVEKLIERVEESCKDSNFTFRAEIEERKNREKNSSLNVESLIK